ncbi:acyl-CoA dehydrogenase family protein [Litorivivens sp.]|uniref:acyl-CoA dehydrogenase family protein n=1 Tax=Litorivivens sp. TaxID=2020868 RepID=UPI003569DFA8
MDFSLTEEQQLLKDSVEKFVASQYSPQQREQLLHASAAFSTDHWKTFAELGWLTIPFSEELGGYGGGIVESAIVMEAFGQALVLEPFVDTVLLCGQLLARSGNVALCERYLTPLMGGELQGALAWQERTTRCNLNHCQTSASRSGDGYVLSGEKVLVSNADANVLIVSARTDGDADASQGISLFAVPMDTSGVSTQRLKLMDGREALNVQLDNCELPADACLKEDAFPLLQSVVDEAVVALCAEAVGAMDYLYKGSVEYSKTRKQFGQPIGKFQALQHRMVDMFMHTEQCRSMLVSALCAVSDNSDDKAQAIAALKAMVGKYGRRVAEEAVQLHGGMGVTHEMNIGHYLKRLMMIDVTFGDASIHRRRYCTLRYAA